MVPPRPDRAVRAALDTVRRHWPFLLLLGAGLVLRVVTQLGYEPALLFIDSKKYIFGTDVTSNDWGSFDALACLLITGSAVAVLLGADLYEFSWRYQLPALVTLPIAGAFGVTALARARGQQRPGPGAAVPAAPDRPAGELAAAASEPQAW